MSTTVPSAPKSLHKREDGKIVVKLRPEKARFKSLLSIDGGGVRGVIPAIVLGGFEQAVKTVARGMFDEIRDIGDEKLVVDVNDYFDVVTGNSAGSILAMYIASGGGSPNLYEEGGPLYGLEPGSSEAALAMTQELAKTTFNKRFITRIPLLSYLSGLFYSKYGREGLEKALTKVFEDIRMSDLKKNTLVTAYELNNARSVVFYKQNIGEISSQGYVFPYEGVLSDPARFAPSALPVDPQPIPGSLETRNFDVPVRVACQASASAPVFFDPLDFSREGLATELGLEEDKISWADGGLVSNNPTIIALAIMGAMYSDKFNFLLPMEKMAVLSLGSGSKIEPLDIGGGRGLVAWNADLISVLMNANVRQNQKIVEGLLEGMMFGNISSVGENYVRVDKVVRPNLTSWELWMR